MGRKKEKEWYCDPTFEQTKGEKGEKSCKDGLLCENVNVDDEEDDEYVCISENNRGKDKPCTAGEKPSQCANGLVCLKNKNDKYLCNSENNREEYDPCTP